MKKEALIVGAGYAGSVSARVLAEAGWQVTILEKRNHIAGNAYDYIDENGVRRHQYGPHIFHTSSQQAVDFLSRFTDWYPYEHRVLGYIEGQLVPIPFNLTSIDRLFEQEKAEHLKQVLTDSYGRETKVPILQLRQSSDPEVRRLAEYIYEHVFKYYTMKQWGYSAEEIDPAVTGRVPVHISYDDRYFQDSFQKMPAEGFTVMFRKMLDHPRIRVQLNTEACEHIRIDLSQQKILVDGQVFDGLLIYTGLIDELLQYCQGDLPYRSLEFEIQTHEGDYQPVGTVNYPTPASQHPYTRISEYKKLMRPDTQPKDRTTIAIEYPCVYQRNGQKGRVPYYPVFTAASRAQYEAYRAQVAGMENLLLLGRLAEYRYYNMDAAVVSALKACEAYLD